MNRTVFFMRIRETLFNGRMGQGQVDGLNILLDTQEQYFPDLPDDHLCIILGTTYHETGATMQPIKEKGGAAYFTRKYDIRGNPRKARELGNVNPGDGAKFAGMGYVQSTGRDNAIKNRKIILEVLGEDVDFERHPEKQMIPRYAAIILFYGMIHGTFTGKKLRDYVDGDGKEDPGEFQASRRVVNGTDRAALIAGYARLFLDAITRAKKAKENFGAVDLSHVKVTTGKSAFESKEVLGTLVSGGTGSLVAATQLIDQGSQAVQAAHTAKDTATSAWDLIQGVGPWIIVLIVIIGAAYLVISERRKKAYSLGI
jgi:putative chitinase